jgi:hypothetical protein
MITPMETDPNKIKKPIFIIAPPNRKVAVGEYSYSSQNKDFKTIIVRKKKAGLKKSESDQPFLLINFITYLMERDMIESALALINKYFISLSKLEKTLLTENIIEATNQYKIPSNKLPESYFDFIASDDSNAIFN